MFVPAYTTLVQTNRSQEIAKQKVQKSQVPSQDFSTKLSNKVSSHHLKSSSSVVIHDFNKNNLTTKQEILNQNTKDYKQVKETLTKFNGQNSLVQAQNAYTNNSKMFSLIKIPTSPLNQKPSHETTLPREPKEIKEANVRYKMINTYIDNNNYYKITA